MDWIDNLEDEFVNGRPTPDKTPKAVKLRGPRSNTPRELGRVGIELVDHNRGFYRCKSCGQTWSPNIQPCGSFPRRWWMCANDRCRNSPAGRSNN